MWASFATDNGRELVQESRGVAADLISETLQIVRSGASLRSLEAEFVPQTLAAARGLGLPDAWVRRITQANPAARQVLGIARLVGGSDAAKLLELHDAGLEEEEDDEEADDDDEDEEEDE